VPHGVVDENRNNLSENQNIHLAWTVLDSGKIRL
jgi:hypothetical protein